MKLQPTVRITIFTLLLLIIPAALSSPSSAQVAVGISVHIGPPALPVYEQPLCPGPGYLWTPGYWAWSDDDGYYWVPGTWVVAPVGLLWTPGYWGWGDGAYLWHAGYWGPHIGFYGGINYGFGYGGVGFVGGEWRGGAFFYNTAVMRVDSVHVTNVYVNKTVIVHNESHVAFNGGQGGVAARPTAREEEYSHEHHQAALASQTQHEHAASRDRSLLASNNHGRPAVAATARPGEFKGHGVVAAKSAGAPYRAPKMSPKEARAPAHAEAKNTPAPHNNNAAHASEAHSSNAHNNARPSNPPSKSGNAGHSENASRPSHAENSGPRNVSHASNSHPSTGSRPEPSHASKPAAPSHPAESHQSAPARQPQPKSAPPKEEKHGKGH